MKEILEKYCKYCQSQFTQEYYYSINLFQIRIINVNRVELWSNGFTIRHNVFTSQEKLEIFFKSLE
jgi:hypothetical protein